MQGCIFPFSRNYSPRIPSFFFFLHKGGVLPPVIYLIISSSHSTSNETTMYHNPQLKTLFPWQYASWFLVYKTKLLCHSQKLKTDQYKKHRKRGDEARIHPNSSRNTLITSVFMRNQIMKQQCSLTQIITVMQYAQQSTSTSV